MSAVDELVRSMTVWVLGVDGLLHAVRDGTTPHAVWVECSVVPRTVTRIAQRWTYFDVGTPMCPGCAEYAEDPIKTRREAVARRVRDGLLDSELERLEGMGDGATAQHVRFA